jgi:exodeoxyribonuclease V alpha subunit
VRSALERRLALSATWQAALPTAALRPILDGLFPPAAAGEAGADWQKMACALAARSGFSILTGGPGTGKTTTVVRLLALLQALALPRRHAGGAARPTLRIRLAAPTGKAAARLNESIAGAVARLPLAGLERRKRCAPRFRSR